MESRWYAVRHRLRLVRRFDIYGLRLTLRAGIVAIGTILLAIIAVSAGVPIATALYVPVGGTLGYIFIFDTPFRGRTLWQFALLAVRFWMRTRRFRRPIR